MDDGDVEPLGEVDPVNPVEGAVSFQVAVAEVMERSLAAGGVATEVGVVLGRAPTHVNRRSGEAISISAAALIDVPARSSIIMGLSWVLFFEV
jgi:hypothetical protein